MFFNNWKYCDPVGCHKINYEISVEFSGLINSSILWLYIITELITFWGPKGNNWQPPYGVKIFFHIFLKSNDILHLWSAETWQFFCLVLWLVFCFVFNYFIYLHSSHCPHLPGSSSHHSSFHSSSPCLERVLPTSRPLPSLGPQVSGGLGTSSPTEVTPGSPLLCKCRAWGLQPAYVCCLHGYMVGGSVSRSSLGSGLVESAGLPMGLPSPSVFSILPLIQP